MNIVNKPYFYGLFFYLFCFYLFIPNHLITQVDDWGYLQNLITGIAGYDGGNWLEPMNYFLRYAGILVYSISKSGYLAVYGVLSIAAFLLYFSCVSLLKTMANGMPGKYDNIWVVVFLLSPIVFHKSGEYSGVSFFWVFYILSICSYMKDKWVNFFLFTLLAFLCRENAIVLLILPMTAIFYKDKDFKERLIIFASAMFIALAFIFIKKIHIPNYGRLHVTTKMLDNIDIINMLGVSIFSSLVSIAAGSIMAYIYRRNCNIPHLSFDNFKHFLPRVILASCLGFLVFHTGDNFRSTVPFISSRMILLGVGLMTFFGFMLAPAITNKKPTKIGIGLGMLFVLHISLIALKGSLGDYYLFETSLLSFLLIYLYASNENTAEYSTLHKLNFNYVISGVMLVNLVFMLVFYYVIQMTRLKITVYENLLSTNQINETQIDPTLFGYTGWKLFPYLIRNEGAEFKGQTVFLNYLGDNTLVVKAYKNKSVEDVEQITGGKVISQFSDQLGLLGQFQIFLVNVPGYKKLMLPQYGDWSIDNHKFEKIPFPTNDIEFSRLVEMAKNDTHLF